MLIFLAGLQSIPESVEEAAKVDGASTFQTFWHITVPLMKPTIFFVVTIGLISTWQVFEQIYATSFGGPQKTTLTPAFPHLLPVVHQLRSRPRLRLSPCCCWW